MPLREQEKGPGGLFLRPVIQLNPDSGDARAAQLPLTSTSALEEDVDGEIPRDHRASPKHPTPPRKRRPSLRLVLARVRLDSGVSGAIFPHRHQRPLG